MVNKQFVRVIPAPGTSLEVRAGVKASVPRVGFSVSVRWSFLGFPWQSSG